jgi:hypothetical protein
MPKARGPGNIGAEPGFKNTDQGVFSLAYDSPMIDAGTNCFLQAEDLIGNPRLLDGNNNRHSRVDMGAYEYVHPKADSNGNGISDLQEIAIMNKAGHVEQPAE